ncbi:response regulator [Aquabacter spiritensis]|uniref:Response regulator receiver domain-containing protein n=1 Tax=Aquabacter spiritensis TaxID=933073 RepID=A0A4R3M0F6_9HYPH|nr:response regulator [Aquabacter spiritensis]TCT06193.1 response regulator receiver domain-containing protein [Aquabacter spiritensis]
MPATILVIEDHPTNRDLMHFLLTKSGFRVLLAEDGTRGLEIARRARPDLVLSDVHMPGLSGFEVVRAMAQDPDLAAIPIIAVTASAMSGDRETMIRAGFHDYVSKPIEPETFVAQVARHLPPGPE